MGLLHIPPENDRLALAVNRKYCSTLLKSVNVFVMSRSGGRGHFDSDCSIFIGNLSQSVTEELLWELFIQAGPLKSVHIPKHRETGQQRPFGFVEFRDDVSVPYACELLDSLLLCGRAIKCKPQSQGKGDSQDRSPSNPYEDGRNRSNDYSPRAEKTYSPRDSPTHQVYGQSPNSSSSLLGTPPYQLSYNQSPPTFFRSSSSPSINQSFGQSPYLLHALQNQPNLNRREENGRSGSGGPMRRTSSYSQHRSSPSSSPYGDRTPRRHGYPY